MRNNLARLIPDLNRAILLLAPMHAAQARAPSSLREVMAAQQSCAAIPIWDGASHATIYRDARVNHAFRAWHDATHASLPDAHAFTLDGERLTCEAQCRQLLNLWPQAAPLAAVVRAEVIGQAEYFAAFGAFPTDQAAFIETYLTELDHANKTYP